LRALCAFSILVQLSKSLVSAIPADTFSARLLFDDTFAQPDLFQNCQLPCPSVQCVLLYWFNARPYIFAVVNCANIALSVFYFPF